MTSVTSVTSMTSATSATTVTSQPPSISTYMASTMENHELPSHNLREEDLGHTAKGGHLQVKVESAIRLDTARNSPTGKQVPAAGEADVSQSSKASNLLDKLLARSATLHQRLDSLTTPVPTSSRPTKVQGDQGVRKPGAILDSCLSRAQELNDKVDKVTTKLKTPAILMAAAGQEANNGHTSDSRPPKATQVHVLVQTRGNTAENSPIGCTSTKEEDQSPGCRTPVTTHCEGARTLPPSPAGPSSWTPIPAVIPPWSPTLRGSGPLLPPPDVSSSWNHHMTGGYAVISTPPRSKLHIQQ